MKRIFIILTVLFTLNLNDFAQDYSKINNQSNSFNYQKHNEFHKKQQNFDAMLDSRLHFTEEQKQKIYENRQCYRKEMQKTVKKMEYLSKKIKRIYLTKKSKIQADIESTPLKLELAILKQNADRMRMENRKKFEQLLDDTQKIEFEKIKQEFHNKQKEKIQKD